MVEIPDILNTVKVPKEFEPLFAKAQEYVSKYFKEKKEDPTKGTIEVFGQRYILVRAAAMSVEFFEVIKDQYKEAGEEEANRIARSFLFDLAHAIGRADAKDFHEKMGLKDPIAKLSAGPVHFAYTGWAFVDIFPESHPSPDENYYLIYDHPYSFESDSWQRAGKKSDFPVCIMNSGYSSGWCEESFGIPLVASEITCMAKGDKACRFIMAQPSKMEGYIKEYLAKNPGISKQVTKYEIPGFFKRKREEEERRRIEEKTAESEKKYRTLVDNAQVGIYRTTLQGEVLLANEALSRMLDYPSIEELKKAGSIARYRDPKERERFITQLKEKGKIEGFETELLTRTEQVRTVIISAVLENNILSGMIMDITERKRLEQEVEKLLQETWNANKELKKIDTLKDEFFSIVTHDLKTPLISLLGYAGILLDGLAGELNQKQKEHLSTIKRQGLALDELISSILDYTRVEFGKLTANPEEFSLDKMIMEIVQDIKPQADQKKIVLTVNLPPGEIIIKCDQGMIRRVLANLVGNAIKYTQEEGKVMVNVSREGAKVRIMVQDNGRGIAPENLPKLFEKFFVVTAKEARAKRSLGLGLYIAKTFTELNGGTLGVESDGEGKGSRFTLELPAS